MEALITVIIMALVALSVGNAAKKLSRNRPGQGDPRNRPGQQSPYAPAQRPMRPMRPTWQQSLPPEMREMLGMDQPQQRRGEGTATEAVSSAEGGGYASGEGMSRGARDNRYGGSLPPPEGYASEEGMSRGAQDNRYGGSLPQPEGGFASMSFVQTAQSAPAPIFAQPKPAPRMTPEEMRRAVILSEVLKRPVSLRRRGYIR